MKQQVASIVTATGRLVVAAGKLVIVCSSPVAMAAVLGVTVIGVIAAWRIESTANAQFA